MQIEKKTIKVYFALLNNGTIRREIQSILIPAILKTPGVEVLMENPNKTWANPISSNRNKIVKRFLETDCDWLFMLDDDVVPNHNPLELVHADNKIDIIGCPALVRSSGQTIVWTAYVPHHNGVGYSSVDLDSFDDMFDILEVSIVGTGCILVRRRVLENLEAPFHPEFQSDGTQLYGTDFAFCRKATAAGYKVYTTVHRRCEHFKTVGLSDFDGWDSVNYFCRDNVPYNIPWGEYSITQKDWKFIQNYKEPLQPKRILEFGSGLSSLLLSEGAEVISYETDPEWKDKIEKLCGEKNKLEIRLWDGHTIPEDLIEQKFDFCFVDGPKERLKGGAGRQVAMEIASKVTDHVMIHDAGRPEEEKWQRKSLRSVFKLIRKSGNHMTRLHYWVRRPHPVTLEEIKEQLKKSKENASDK